MKEGRERNQNPERITQVPSKIPEEVLDRGFRATMEYVQQFIPRENIAPRIRKMRAEQAQDRQGATEVKSSHESLSRDAEINAMAGHFMEAVWKDVRVWLDTHPGSLGRSLDVRGSGGKRSLLEPIHESEIHTVFKKNRAEGLKRLAGSSLDTLSYYVHEFRNTHNEAITRLTLEHIPNSRWPHEEQAFVRYADLLQQTQFHNVLFNADPAIHLLRGMSTAQAMNWAILSTFPEMYEQQFKRSLNKTTLDKLADAGRNFALQVASLQFDMFGPVQDTIMFSEDVMGIGHPLKYIRIEEQSDGYRLEIEKETLRRIADDCLKIVRTRSFAKRDSTRTGCPAIAARGPDGKNLVVELYDWSLDLARKYYFPTFLKK